MKEIKNRLFGSLFIELFYMVKSQSYLSGTINAKFRKHIPIIFSQGYREELLPITRIILIKKIYYYRYN